MLFKQDNSEGKSDFWGITLTIFIEIPFTALVMFLVENKKVGRKNLMTMSYGACSIFLLITFFYSSPDGFFFFLVSGAKVKLFYFLKLLIL